MSDIEFKKLQVIQENLRINGMTIVELLREVVRHSFEDYLNRLEGEPTMEDFFRLEYKSLSDEQKGLMHEFKKKAAELKELFDNASGISDKRRMALAITNLEQSVMWAIKAIT